MLFKIFVSAAYLAVMTFGIFLLVVTRNDNGATGLLSFVVGVACVVVAQSGYVIYFSREAWRG